MATSSKIHLSASQTPQFFLSGLTSDSADKASELLQKNHEEHHMFFNDDGFHNHIVHHLLTLFALNASPSELQKGYNDNAYYQRHALPVKRSVVTDMHIPEKFKSYLGKEKHFHDFLAFFQSEMSEKGWQNVVNEYVFKGDERADDMLVRLYAGFLHPIIHLGFGIEFEQPAIVAEGLAQAAVHDTWMAPFFTGAEKEAKKRGGQLDKSLIQLLQEIRADSKLSSAAHWSDGNKIRDGILKRAPEEMTKYASQYSVSEDELEEKTAEMINAVVLYTGAAQHPPSQVKFDFFYIHSLNCSIFFSNFLKQDWISTANKVRLLEWKVRTDLAMYASRGAPELRLDEIENYKSKQDSSWEDVIKRVIEFSDDGHASKLVRALANGQKACEKFEAKEGFVVKGDAWRKLGNMAIDSVEAGEPVWVRSTGFEEAWRDVPQRDAARL